MKAQKARKLTTEEKAQVRSFCGLVFEVPVGKILTPYNVQGALGWKDLKAILPAACFDVAVEDEWLEALPGGSWKRLALLVGRTSQKSTYMRYVALGRLKTRIHYKLLQIPFYD